MARRLFAAPHRGTAPALSERRGAGRPGAASLVAAVDELAELSLTPSAAELVELLEGLTVAAPGPRDGADAVLLAEPLEVRARRFRAVFVCGLQEGEFPRPASPEPFLSDERRCELAAAGGPRLRAREDALPAERYLFYAALSRATERVFLAYRSSDEEGNLALPSPFIADVAELLAPDWPARRRRRLLADVVWEPSRAPTERERARAQADCGTAPGGELPLRRRVLGAEALSRMRHTEILSAGALEAYADCPVRWLIERELQPQPLAPQPEPLTRGSLMHDVLERLLRELDGPVTPGTLAGAQAILDRLLAELAADGGTALGAGSPEVVRAGALRAIEADLRRYLAHEARTAGQWRPHGLELRFGFEDDERSLPALELGEGPGRVRVRGMIDRVDVDGAGHAVVRDYKSGARRPAWSAAAGPRTASSRSRSTCSWCASSPAPSRWPASTSRCAATICAPAGSSSRARPSAAPWSPPTAAPRRSSTQMLADAAERAVALAASLRAGALEPVPAELLARRLRVPGDLPQPVSVSPPLDPPSVAGGDEPRADGAPGAGGVRAWTPEQQRAIERRAGDLLLDAGAGSGKTSVLVERFVQSVLEDGVDVSAILTITFTEKAAAELRDRIRARLRELGAIDAARRTEGAFISTIHGFCARVLRANALAAGLDPQFAVLDRYQSEPLSAAAFEAALEELARGDGGPGAVDLIADYAQWSLRAAVLSVYAQLRSAGQLRPRLPEIAAPAPDEDTDPAHPAAGLIAAARALAAELGAIAEPSPRVCEAIDRVGACLDLVASGEVWPAELEAGRLPRNGAALSTDACVRYTEALGRFRAHCATVAARPVRDLLDRLLEAYGRHYEERKRAASGLDFEDLELMTRQLLRDDGELRQRYAARFERIMVDELQDTNRVQLELIELDRH